MSVLGRINDGAKDWVGTVADVWLEKERIDAGTRIAQEPHQQAQQRGEFGVHDPQEPTPAGWSRTSVGGLELYTPGLLLAGAALLGVLLLRRGGR